MRPFGRTEIDVADNMDVFLEEVGYGDGANLRHRLEHTEGVLSWQC